MYTRNESVKSYSRQKVTVGKMRPSVFAYELEIYILFLKRFLINPSREWKIMELWEYDVDSNYECEVNKYIINDINKKYAVYSAK